MGSPGTPLDPPLSMKVADQVPCCFHKYRIYQNVPDVYVSRRDIFSGPEETYIQ